MILEVVINRCYGGFGISKECCERMAELGSKVAKKKLEDCDRFDGSHWCGSIEIPRHDKRLVRAVRELGDKANGEFSKLEIVDFYVPDVPYEITSDDGFESLE